jgi:hypothetical protein
LRLIKMIRQNSMFTSLHSTLANQS